MKKKKYQLTEEEIPEQWYNVQADLPEPLEPPLKPDGEPVTPDELGTIFPMNLIEQEVSEERWIDVPNPVLEVLAGWRPTPLFRATALEEYLDTPAKIFYKHEGMSPPGSHKPNTAVAQAYFNKEFGVERITTETGAGQWGSALSFAAAQFSLQCKVFMVRVSYDQKPMRRRLMQLWGGDCIPSPSETTKSGRQALDKDPDTPGSLGIAISEAVEEAVTDSSDNTRYTLGSVLNHVMLHQTVIGLEAKQQLAQAGEDVDVIIGCAGGGSNFAGLAFPFVPEKLESEELEIIPTEPSACPTLTKGPFHYDHGDTAQLTPLLAMHTLGHDFVPPPIHAGGLRYHGMAPLVSHLTELGLFAPRSCTQLDCYRSGLTFARTEGFVPAPETTHAINCAIDEAVEARENGEKKTILFNFSGHGMLDLESYGAYFDGKLEDREVTAEEVQLGMDALEENPSPRELG